MATSPEYIEFIIGQLHTLHEITCKKMFGEYMIYANGKPVFTVCDNTVFVKKSDGIAPLMQNADCGYPYEGAKEHYILDVENPDFASEVFNELEKITPLPKKRTPKK